MSMLSIIAASRRRYAFDPDALAYLAAVEAADTQALEPAVRVAIDQFVKGCKTDGIWDAIKASCILAGARTLDGCLVPLKGTAPTNVGGNFVSGDYNRKTGLKGDGSTKFLDSNRNNNADPQNSHHLAVWVTEVDNGTGSRGIIGTSGGSTGESGIAYVTTSGGFHQWQSRFFHGVNGTYGNSRTTGLLAISRSAKQEGSIKLPGHATSWTLTNTSQTPKNQTIHVFTRNLTTGWNGSLSYYSIGEDINIAALDSRLTTLMSDLNSAIP